MSITLGERLADVAPHAAVPLAVDLDGTLINSDSLHETFVDCIKLGPAACWRVLGALRHGKAAFKREVATRVDFDPTNIPYNEPLVDLLKSERIRGRRIGLFTAADQLTADRIASHLDLFDVVRGSDGMTNLSGLQKVAAIREEFGDRFMYAGNSPADKPVFDVAESAILVGDVDRLRRMLKSDARIDAVFPGRSLGLRELASAMRLEHWSKNVLVFVAPILGFQYASSTILWEAVVLFVAMGCLASASYLINDLLDLAADRQHARKRFRLLASGAMSIRSAVLVAALLTIAAFALGLLLPWGALAILGVYLATTLAYSLWFKRKPIIDVVVLAFLFTLRVIAGGFLLPAPLSPWLLIFSMLLFVGLAMIKRYAELDRAVQRGEAGITARGYTARDLPLLLAAGVASGFSAIVIFMIYLINNQYPAGVYAHPELLWAMMPIILLWILRIWHLTIHGKVDDDPVVFALRDRVSLVLGALSALTFLGAHF